MDFLALVTVVSFIAPWIGFVVFAFWCVAKVKVANLKVEEQRTATRMMLGNQLHSAVQSVKMDQEDRVELRLHEDFVDRLYDVVAPGTAYGFRKLNDLEKLIRRGLANPQPSLLNERQVQFDNSIVLPTEVVEALELKTGDFVSFVKGVDGIRVVKCDLQEETTNTIDGK